MAKVQEIGPYSAYAIAVKYGYKGTEEEWVKEQEANRKAAEAAAAAAAQSAKDAAASASGAAQSGQQAVQNIQNAQTTALQAIDTAKQQAVQAAQAEAEKAAASAGQAASSAAEAAQSATNAAAEVGKVQNAGTAAVQSVKEAQNTATEAVSDAQQTATQAVSETQATAVSAVQEAGTTQTGAVASAGTSAVADVSNAKTEALSQISAAGTAQVSAVGTAGADAVEDVNDAKTAALEAIDAANAALPSPTQSDAGKVPTVKADGSAYELAGPYAPLSAAIRPTASGNPVSITDSVEWPLQGLRVYGKSTQETTTGAQLIDTQAWQAADSAYYKVAVDGGMIQLKPDDRTAENVPTFLELEAGDYTASINTGFMLQIKKDGNNLVSVNFTNNYKATFTLDSPAAIGLKVYEYPGTNNYPSSVAYPMINTGSTAKSWEPYTGGKPSPSPEYPQPIVSAGDEGSIGLTISDGADQSQQLTISTPNGLPGIPVDSGGNYTDAEGQQWVCDYKDYKNEVYIKILTLIPDLSIGTFTTHANGMFICDLANYSAPNANSKTLASMCTHFPTVVSQDSFGIVVSSNYIIIGTALAGTFDSVDDFNSLLREQSENNTPVQLLYYHNETTESPLSEEEIAAYRALHTYDGATVVSTAEDVAGLEVKYLADGEKYVERIVSQKAPEAAAAHTMALLADGIREGVNGV